MVGGPVKTEVEKAQDVPSEAPAEASDGQAPPNHPGIHRWWRWFRGRPPEDEETEVTPIRDPDPPEVVVETKELNPGYAHGRVLFDEALSHHRYETVEPPMTDRQRQAFAFIQDTLIRTMDLDLKVVERGVSPESIEYLHRTIDEVIRTYRVRLSPLGRQRVHYYLERDFTGFGPIDVPMRDPDIEDISCDGTAVPVYVYHRRHGSMATTIQFADEDALDGFVIRMAQRCGKQITIANPLLDGALPDGSRLQATLGREVTDNGSTFTIRRFNTEPFSPIDLVRMGTMSPMLLAYMWMLVQYGASMVFSGGTASGKTTSLNAVSLFIPPQVKIVSIEDTREINLPHPNWVRSVTRAGNRTMESKNVDMFDLLVAALRQRPEYILVGEVRGKEATVAFQAMATGHTVYATLHADSARSVVYRLENEPINVPRLVLQALDLIVLQALVTREGKRLRRIKEVVEIVGIDPASKELLTHTAFEYDVASDTYRYTGKSYKLDLIAQKQNWSLDRVRQELEDRTRLIESLRTAGRLRFEEISRIAQTYYNQPDRLESEVAALKARAPAVGEAP